MDVKRESIFSSTVRSFFKALAAVIGVGLALILLASLVDGFGEGEVSRTATVKMLPNAEGKREPLGSKAPVILQLNIHGVIGLEQLTADKVRQLLVESREGDLKDNRVKGLLLSIRSPGGTVTDAEGIYQAIKQYKELYKVPVIAYVDGLSASGALFVTAAADKIVSSDASLIGSVGVITSPFFNVTNLMEKAGVEALTIYAGKDKDEMNPFRPWTKEEGEPLHAVINYYYQYFVDLVTQTRPQLNREKLINEYGAKVFPATQALEYGYIDAAGYTPTDALKLVLAEAQLEDKDYRVVELDVKGWSSIFLNSQSPLFTGRVHHQLDLGATFHPDLQGQILYLYRP